MSIRRSSVVAPIMYSIIMIQGACKHHDGEDSVDAGVPPDACEGIACSIVDCGSSGMPATSVTGTVYAPNGTLPLFGVNVYVPASDPGPLLAGVQCDRCTDGLPGGAIVQTTTDENGQFVLYDVPATTSVPLIVQVGKWRRRLTLDTVAACQNNPLPAASTTLPRKHSEGDMPQIAITTGSADALDCLVRKLGIDDSEITTDAQSGKVHLYYGNGAQKFASGFGGGSGTFNNATTLWGSVDKLSGYDIAIFSCEGAQHPETKSQAALQAVHDYADRGGRVFLSHWHNIWVGGDKNDANHVLADWKATSTFDYAAGQPADGSTQPTLVDENASKGAELARWLVNVGASTVRDQLPVVDARYTCKSVTAGKAEQWVYVDPDHPLLTGVTGVQDMLFTTPLDQAEDQRCGKVVFSDMHVSSGSSSKSGTAYPGGCSSTPLTPQEKALAFIFFDIASCVGVVQ
jgi:hypothetical protein